MVQYFQSQAVIKRQLYLTGDACGAFATGQLSDASEMDILKSTEYSFIRLYIVAQLSLHFVATVTVLFFAGVFK